MKKTIILFFTLLVGYFVNAQIVNIPDANFKNALISLGVDTNNNGEIEYTEAEAVDSLNVAGVGIEEITGIEAFINIEYLDCSNNEAYGLDVSNATKLISLNCNYCLSGNLNLSLCTLLKYYYCRSTFTDAINVSNCPQLEELDCSGSIIQNLNLSNNHRLRSLECEGNLLSSLNLSSNDSLEYLNCSNNYFDALIVPHNQGNHLQYLDCSYTWIQSLDLSQNYNLTYLNLQGLSDLDYVCVWTLPFPPAGVTVIEGAGVNFIICNVNIPNSPVSSNQNNKLYPNPTNGILSINDASVKKLEVLNLSGTLLLSKENSSELDLTNYPKGIYMVKIYTDKGISVEKVMVN